MASVERSTTFGVDRYLVVDWCPVRAARGGQRAGALGLGVTDFASCVSGKSASMAVGWLFLTTNQTSYGCHIDRFCTARDTELFQDMCHVDLDRGFADVEERSDLLVTSSDRKVPPKHPSHVWLGPGPPPALLI